VTRAGAQLAASAADVTRRETDPVAADAEIARLEAQRVASEAALRRAEAELQHAEDHLKRVEPLLPEGFVTADRVEELRTRRVSAAMAKEQARTSVDAARAALDEARARKRAALAALDATKAQHAASVGALAQAKTERGRAEDSLGQVGNMNARVAAAEAAVHAAALDLAYCRVTAPFTGRVVNLDISVGAFGRAGVDVFTLADTGTWYVIANFRETQLRHIRAGASRHSPAVECRQAIPRHCRRSRVGGAARERDERDGVAARRASQPDRRAGHGRGRPRGSGPYDVR